MGVKVTFFSKFGRFTPGPKRMEWENHRNLLRCLQNGETQLQYFLSFDFIVFSPNSSLLLSWRVPAAAANTAHLYICRIIQPTSPLLYYSILTRKSAMISHRFSTWSLVYEPDSATIEQPRRSWKAWSIHQLYHSFLNGGGAQFPRKVLVVSRKKKKKGFWTKVRKKSVSFTSRPHRLTF